MLFLIRNNYFLYSKFFQNQYNKIILLVGSDCIERFLHHIEVKFYFLGINSLKNQGIPNQKFVEYLFIDKILNNYEMTFYMDLYNKKALTERQKAFKNKLNEVVLNKILQEK